MAIETTNFEVVSTGASYSIPGDWSIDQIKNMYSATINGLSTMQATATEEGGVRTISFRPASGTKG